MESTKSLPIPGFKLRPLGRPARNQSLYRLPYSGVAGNVHRYTQTYTYTYVCMHDEWFHHNPHVHLHVSCPVIYTFYIFNIGLEETMPKSSQQFSKPLCASVAYSSKRKHILTVPSALEIVVPSISQLDFPALYLFPTHTWY